MSTKTRRRMVIKSKDSLPEDEFAPYNVKVRITTFVDGDVILALKKAAKSKGLRYQTLLNQALRQYVTGGELLAESRLRTIIREELRKSA